MASVAVFDINETTLDLGPARKVVDDLLGQRGFDIFFGRLLQTSMVATSTDNYQDFSVLAAAALDSAAQTVGIQLPADALSRFGAAMASLSVYPDVIDGLDRLKDAGWSLVALTNSAQASVDAQLAGAGVADRFDQILSVDLVRAFKPVAAPYLMALERLRVQPAEAVMVACHDWDLAGAKKVGMQTAFIARPNLPFSTAFPAADYCAANFRELADQLLR
jgi:2-haloacid dehalogenase